MIVGDDPVIVSPKARSVSETCNGGIGDFKLGGIGMVKASYDLLCNTVGVIIATPKADGWF